nr:unnamed protein product [Digitaria exilis]
MEGGADKEAPKEEDNERRRQLLLVLATLVATLTYQAGLNPPGGIWDNEEDGHRPGHAVLKGRPHDARLKAFFYCNAMAFVASLVTLVILLDKKLLLWNYENYGFMGVTLLALLAAYAAGSSLETDTTIYVSSLVGTD